MVVKIWHIGQSAMHTWFKIIKYLATLLTLLVWCARAKKFMRAGLLIKRGGAKKLGAQLLMAAHRAILSCLCSHRKLRPQPQQFLTWAVQSLHPDQKKLGPQPTVAEQ
jgi:hypothetical protein